MMAQLVLPAYFLSQWG